MSDTEELKKIKKIYGEKFKNLCREMFPVILEQEGTLLTILGKKFSHNCNSLYETITGEHLETEFKDYIYSEFDPDKEKEEQVEKRTPYEILDEAGYILYECKTEEDIQSFRKYYASSEVLCTIYNGGRLNTRYCFFAVRKDVAEINREEFNDPKKTDKYSISVLGIQFSKETDSRVEIISRYNHTVNNPNCTLDNDLDRLASGLSQSFSNLLEERGVCLNNSQSKKGFELPGYTLANDGRYYKYNMEVNGVYYCPGNIVISNGEAKQVVAPEKGIVIDNFCLDLEKKEIRIIDKTLQDSFVDGIKDIEKIEIERAKDNKGRAIKIHLRGKEEPIIIGIDKDNQIIRYENQYLQQVENYFLFSNTELKDLRLPKLQKARSYFLSNNIKISQIDLPELQQAGDCFFCCATRLTGVNLPELQQVGDFFLWYNERLDEISLPKLQQAGECFLERNIELKEISLPELQRVGSSFLYYNERLDKVNLPKMQQVGDNFLWHNIGATEINMPNMQQVGNNFLSCNTGITRVNMPKLQQVGNNFLRYNTVIFEANMPKLQQVGDYFFGNNTEITEISMLELQQVGEGFFAENVRIEEINMPELQRVGDYFLGHNIELTRLNMPKLRRAGEWFLSCNTGLTAINLPELQQVGEDFLRDNTVLKSINIPLLPELENSLKLLATEKQNTVKVITSADIAKLDQRSHITRFALKNAGEVIQKLNDRSFERDEKGK